MLFPIRTDRPMKHTPWVNYALIVANVVIFMITIKLAVGEKDPFVKYYLHPESLNWTQFFTYQFLHSSWEHLIFNMLFLYVFGNNLEDRFGHVGYLAFYLTGGILAGYGHILISASPSPVLGASGSISAVAGAYLALFPRAYVTVFFIFMLFDIHSMWIILLSFFQDLFFQLSGAQGVAYLAHLSGNVFGFIVGMSLLAVRILPREPYDFLALTDRWNRRRQLRAVTRQGKSPWEGQISQSLKKDAKPDSPQAQRMIELRSEIAITLAKSDDVGAVDGYAKLLMLDATAALSQKAQLDVANYAMSSQRYEVAAHAYEAFLKTYSSDSYSKQVELILGLIYARYLDQPARARELLTAASEHLDDKKNRQTALDILKQLDADAG